MGLADYYGLTGGSRPVPARPLRTVRTRAVQQPAEKPKEKPRSLWRQFGDALASVPAGVGHLAGRAVETVHAPIKAGGTVLDDAFADITGKRSVDWNPWNDGKSVGDTLEGLQREAAPLVADLADSSQRTVHRVSNPTEYGRAWREGRIVETLLEDVGNAAMLAGVGGAMATDLGAARLGSGLTRAGALGGSVADAPISLPRAGLRAVGRPLAEVVDTAPLMAKVRNLNPLLTTSEGRAIRREVSEGIAGADRANTETARRLKRGAERSGVDLDEQAAARALVTGEAQTWQALEQRAGMHPDDFYNAVTPMRREESYLSQPGYELAKSILDGTADAETIARVQRFADDLRREGDVVTGEALGGLGREHALDPEYVTSNDPLTLVRMRAADNMSPAELQAARTRATDPATGQIDPRLLDIELGIDLNDPATYAARWRSPMIASQRISDALEAQAAAIQQAGGTPGPLPRLPRTPEELIAAGVDTTTYLPEGTSPLVMPQTAGRLARPMEEGSTLAGTRRLTSEEVRSGGGPAPHSARTLADMLGRERRTARINETFKSVIAGHSRNAINELDAPTLQRIERDARDLARQRGGSAASQEATYRAERGAAILDEMEARGLEAWPASGKLDQRIRADDIDVDTTPFLPAGLKERLTPYWNPRPPGAVLRGLKWSNRKFKGAVLPFSLRWQIGDAMSNFLMATVGGVDPVTLFARMKDVKRIGADENLAPILDQAIPETGLFYDEQGWLSGDAATGAKGDRRNLPVLGQRRPVRAFQQGSFKVNEISNRYQRQAFYLEKLQRELDRDAGTRGMTWDEVANRIKDPKIEKAIARAVNDTATMLGDMANLTPFEKRYMREILPFYPWARHVAKLATKLAIDHPARLAFLMRVGELAADGDAEDLPPFLRGSVQGPGGYWQTSFMNPLADLEGGVPVTPEAFLRSTSPAIKLAVLAGTGINLSRAGMQASRPEGTSALDWYGRETINPFIKDPGALAYQAARVFPLGRAGWDLGFGREARYDTGDTVMRGSSGTPLDREPRWRSLPQLAGIPLPTPVEDVESIRRTRERRLRQARND